jgi:hypothetical protein
MLLLELACALVTRLWNFQTKASRCAGSDFFLDLSTLLNCSGLLRLLHELLLDCISSDTFHSSTTYTAWSVR